jgi:hypothetical protein
VHTGIDGAVLAVSELLFLLFGLPFGDAIYNDKPITLRHWLFLSIAILCAIGGPMWPTIRNRYASPHIAASVANAARDARIWIAVLLAFLLYGVAPDIYRRATAPVALSGAIGVMPIGKETTQALGEVPPLDAVGPVSWNTIFGTTRNSERMFALFLDGTSISKKPVQMTGAFLESGITGERLEMKIQDTRSTDTFFPSESNPIPVDAPVRLFTQLNFPDGLENKVFLERWGKIWFNATYENEKPTRILFDEKTMQSYFPGLVGPHVTKRTKP